MSDVSPSGKKRGTKGCLLAFLALVAALSIVCLGLSGKGRSSDLDTRAAARATPPVSPGSTGRSSDTPASAPEVEAPTEQAQATFEERFHTVLGEAMQGCYGTEHAVSCASGVCVARWRASSTAFEYLVTRLRLYYSQQIAPRWGIPDEALPCRVLNTLGADRAHYAMEPSGVEKEVCTIMADPAGPPLDEATKDEALARCRALVLPED